MSDYEIVSIIVEIHLLIAAVLGVVFAGFGIAITVWTKLKATPSDKRQ